MILCQECSGSWQGQEGRKGHEVAGPQGLLVGCLASNFAATSAATIADLDDLVVAMQLGHGSASKTQFGVGKFTRVVPAR